MSTQEDVLTMSRDGIASAQVEGIRKTAIHCYEDIPFYHKSFDEAGFDPYEQKLLGITAMQKQLGKKRFDELLSGLVIKPTGKPVLAPASDKRAEYKSAADDFDMED